MTLKMPFGLILNISVFHPGASKELVSDVTSKFGKGGKVIAAIVNFLCIFFQLQKHTLHFLVIFIILKRACIIWEKILVVFGGFWKILQNKFFFFGVLKEYFFS